jgi:hypothetical protein
MQDPIFDDVVVLVEASSTEVFFLWKELHSLYEWEEICNGKIYSIDGGTIQFLFAHIYDKKFCFYDCVSQKVDWYKINKYLKKEFPNIKSFDAMNFHNALNYVFPNGVKIKPVSKEDFIGVIQHAKQSGQTATIKRIECIIKMIEEGMG